MSFPAGTLLDGPGQLSVLFSLSFGVDQTKNNLYYEHYESGDQRILVQIVLGMNNLVIDQTLSYVAHQLVSRGSFIININYNKTILN